MQPQHSVREYLDRLPRVDDLRRELAANLREARLLRRLLKLSQQQAGIEEARRCEK